MPPPSSSRPSSPSPSSSAVLPLLGRGLVAGGAAGFAAGLFSLLLAEPLMDRAIRAEEKRAAAQEHASGAAQHHEELFTRSTQHAGLVITAVVAGLAVGILFAVAYALVHRRDPRAAPWPRALAFAGAAFVAVSLLPGLRYPANPPGVGDSATVGERQALWLASVAIGILGMFLVRQVYVRMSARAVPVRQIAAALTGVAVLAVLFLLPDNPDPVPVDAKLLWDFRVLSIASHALLWAVLAAVFGGLGLRAVREGAARGATVGASAAGVPSRPGATPTAPPP
ncbi:CbtA family protein [Streptomyces sp. NPDC055189]